MKLLRIKILGDNFRSLIANKDYVFNYLEQDGKLFPKIFAGLNGSGKSNFLELLAEIFYYLERCQLESTPKEYFKSKNIGFELEYILPKTEIETNIIQFEGRDVKKIISFENKQIHVKIVKQLDELAEFSFSEINKNTFTRLDHNTFQLLPSKIIAYTSGQNELLSNPFFRLRYHYYNELRKNKSNNFSDRMFFLNSESNYAIFLANLLLANKDKLKYMRQIFKIEDLASFRITINYKKKGAQNLQFSNQIENYIYALKSCSTMWIDRKEDKCLILDFDINEATHCAFSHFFKTPFQLFQAFYQLESLNLLSTKTTTIGFVTKAHKTINIADELSKPDPSDLVFRIEKIKIDKKDNEGRKIQIYYKSLSDGEHQFNEVIGSIMMMEEEGCLFLMDEPDTHFNPIWRAKMIGMINHVAAKEYTLEGKAKPPRRHEIIITTHSPFVISDSRRENVYKFVRKNGSIYLENPEYETYGTSINFILESVFDRDITISDFSYNDMVDLKESIKTLEDVNKAKSKLLKFGESVEKFDAYTFLMEKEKELKADKDVN